MARQTARFAQARRSTLPRPLLDCVREIASSIYFALPGSSRCTPSGSRRRSCSRPGLLLPDRLALVCGGTAAIRETGALRPSSGLPSMTSGASSPGWALFLDHLIVPVRTLGAVPAGTTVRRCLLHQVAPALTSSCGAGDRGCGDHPFGPPHTLASVGARRRARRPLVTSCSLVTLGLAMLFCRMCSRPHVARLRHLPTWRPPLRSRSQWRDALSPHRARTA